MIYSKAQIAYHWASALLVLIMAGTGLAYSYELTGDGIMTIHQIAGQLFIVILVLRIMNKATHRTSAPTVASSEVMHRVAQVVHLSLYACLIAYLATGYIAASAETDSSLVAPISLALARSDMGETLLELHYLLKWVLLGLLSLHIAAALKHQYWDKDASLSNMTFNSRKG